MSDPKPIMTPAAFLEASSFARYLKRRGLRDDQLKGVRFSNGRFEGEPVSEWPVHSMMKWPDDLRQYLLPWCAFQWLILEDPPHSRDTREAWNLVAQCIKTLETRSVSTKKASNSRVALGNVSRQNVEAAANKILGKTPDLTRKTLAQRIAFTVYLSEPRITTILKQLKLPKRRLRVQTKR